MTNQTSPQHTYLANLPAYFIGEFENETSETVYVCDWTYHHGETIGYEISRAANGRVVGSYAAGADLTGHAESDTMTIEEMTAHIIDLAKQRLDALPAA